MKRTDALRPFSHDHYDGLAAVRRLRLGLEHHADLSVMAAYVRHLWTYQLARHFEQEERLLLPLLYRTGADTLAHRMVEEHRRLTGDLERLHDGATEEAIRTFAEDLNQHIRFEERVLFPALEASLNAAALRVLEAELHADDPTPEPAWTQAFWQPTA